MSYLFVSILIAISNIYSIQFSNIDGNNFSMSSCQNKKILIVNIASSSPHAGQLAQLQSLRNQFGDSLVIIAFPSNSFGNEPKTNLEIKTYCQSTFNCTFLLASKNEVTGSSRHPIYQWLGQASENGVLSWTLKGDFQKFLLDRTGKVVGVFAPSVLPTDATIIDAINEN